MVYMSVPVHMIPAQLKKKIQRKVSQVPIHGYIILDKIVHSKHKKIIQVKEILKIVMSYV